MEAVDAGQVVAVGRLRTSEGDAFAAAVIISSWDLARSMKRQSVLPGLE